MLKVIVNTSSTRVQLLQVIIQVHVNICNNNDSLLGENFVCSNTNKNHYLSSVYQPMEETNINEIPATAQIAPSNKKAVT